MDDEGTAGESLDGGAPAPSPDPQRRAFAVLDTGHVVGDDDEAIETAEALLYIARIADTVGYHLGAGPLAEVEMFGGISVHATLDPRPDGSVALEGCIGPSTATAEDLKAWLAARPGR